MYNEETRENVVAGMVGAFLFALAGGVIWFVLYLMGFLAGISGLIGVICAVKGYSIFAKRESTKGVVISVIMALIVIVIAWYLCLGYDVYQAHLGWYEEGLIDYTLTFFEGVQAGGYYLSDPEIGPLYIKDLGIGLLFCIIGGGSYVVNKIKSVRAAQNAPVAVSPASAEESTENTEG